LNAGFSYLSAQLTTTIRSIAGDSKNRLPLGVIVFLLIFLSLRALSDELSYEIGVMHWSMFVTPDERFSDLLKAAMSYLNPSLVGESKYLHWPAQFRAYLIHNENTGPLRYNLHLLPVANLLLISAAKLILVTGATQTLLIFFCAYIGFVGLIARFFMASMNVTRLDALAFAFVLIGSYPALFMLTRGNFNAGFTSLLLCTYILATMSGKVRWLGWTAFVLAVNMRPNAAILAGLEFVASENFRKAFLNIFMLGLLSLVAFGLSYELLNSINPIYTIPNLLNGLHVYNATYFLSDVGDDFNLSVYAADKFVRHIWHIGPYFSETAFDLITLCGVVMIAVTLWLVALRRLSGIEVVFLALAFCVMLTPVFSLYHMPVFAAALALILQENRKRGMVSERNIWMMLIIILLVISPLGGPRTNGLVCSVLLLFGTIRILYREITSEPPRHLEKSGAVQIPATNS
jgi:hypothetical protein